MRRSVSLVCLACLLVGGAAGWALAKKGSSRPGYAGLSAEDAAAALLESARQEAGNGSWELIAVGRVLYLSGDRERGQAIFDRVTSRKPEKSDWFRLGNVYAEASEWDKAWACFDRVFELSPKDDRGLTFAGAWHNIAGDREGAERLFDRAFDNSPDEFWNLVNAAGSYLGVPPR